MATKTQEQDVLQVEFSEERNYGSTKVRFGVKCDYSLAKYESILQCKQSLKASVYAMFDDYEANELPSTREHQYKENVEKPTDSDTWQKALLFRREIKGNKTYYNFVTPRYPKFGIAAWDECKGRDEMIAKLGNSNEIQLDGYRVRVDESGKYPKAVEVDLQF